MLDKTLPIPSFDLECEVFCDTLSETEKVYASIKRSIIIQYQRKPREQ